MIEPRRRMSVEVLRRGQRTGEIRTDLDLDLMHDLFVGPMLVRTVVRPEGDLPEELAAQIVDVVLAGLRPAQ